MRPLLSTDRQALHVLHLFNNTHGALTYGREEVREASGGKTLWLECMEQLSTPFFTMPLRADANVDRNLTYDPLRKTPGEYLHAVERAIDKTLRRARIESPVFWSHVHRYIPSDSVWCEKPSPLTPKPENARTKPIDKFMDQTVKSHRVYSPTLDQTMFPADVLTHCFCGWSSGESCSVPEEQHKLPGSAAWVAIRDRGTFETREDLLIVV